jgi:rhodanese-related sulfurtransferase
VLTGDTLFIGDVGRPDLVGAQGLSAESMAALLYDSLHRKLLALPDTVQVYPAHGAGSLCGRNISQQTSSTIGEQRRVNYALQPMPKERFVRMVTSDLPETPQYFPRDVAINREGAPPLADRPLPAALSPADARALQAQGAIVLDVRSAPSFGTAHVPGSLNVGLGGQFASWAGALVPHARPVVLIAEDESGVREGVLRLARVGLENVAGYLAGGIAAWDRAREPLASLPQIAVDELKERLQEQPQLNVVDVRRPAEWLAGHVPGAVNIPLDRLERDAARLDPKRATVVICAGGYRSSAAASLLEQRGFRELSNVVGGTSAWLAAGYPTEALPDTHASSE